MRVTIEIPDGVSAPAQSPDAVDSGQSGMHGELALDAGAAPTAFMDEAGQAETATAPGVPSAVDAGPPAADLITALEGEPEATAPGVAGSDAPTTRTNGEPPTRQPPGFPVGQVRQPGDSVRLEVFRDPGGKMTVRSLSS